VIGSEEIVLPDPLHNDAALAILRIRYKKSEGRDALNPSEAATGEETRIARTLDRAATLLVVCTSPQERGRFAGK